MVSIIRCWKTVLLLTSCVNLISVFVFMFNSNTHSSTGKTYLIFHVLNKRNNSSYDSQWIQLQNNSLRDAEVIKLRNNSLRDAEVIKLRNNSLHDAEVIKLRNNSLRDAEVLTLRNNSLRDAEVLTLRNNSLRDAEEIKLQNNSLRDAHAIKLLMTTLNKEQIIRNLKRFQLHLNHDSVVMLVQVHNRVQTFRLLLESLRKVRNINETLVIFSHDMYSEEIFNMVQSIQFCPVMQIFYPYAIQIYDKNFPGNHSNDCPRDIKRAEAMKMKCNNALYPDTYNHYRQGGVCQIKHHWLWKLHFVFDSVTVLRHYDGVVLLLEDDHYVTEDVVHFVQKMNQIRNSTCSSCRMLMTGMSGPFDKTWFKWNSKNVMFSYYSAGIGGGIGVNRTFWKVLKSCAKYFCTYDDYNWDYSLEYASRTCLKEVMVMQAVSSRVIHTGLCQGYHSNNRKCNFTRIVSAIDLAVKNFRENMFPENISVISRKAKLRKLPRVNGGWSDPRDHQLCFNMMNNITDSEDVLNVIQKKLTPL